MTTARDFARHAKHNEFGHQGPYYLKQGYIWWRSPNNFDPVVGRVYGGDGSATYQLAARPYDECPVHGHANIQAAFEAAVKVLNERSQK